MSELSARRRPSASTTRKRAVRRPPIAANAAVADFSIDRYDVTNAEFARFVDGINIEEERYAQLRFAQLAKLLAGGTRFFLVF